ncbi:hypothetical protein [Terrarubrum flagellatum]|uniref:hypothetical protein n=1 Tax=Terrirubrum flagellatum TaxID=2895980 RepID=UPI00314547D2
MPRAKPPSSLAAHAPLANRVAPTGDLVSTPARGGMLGNRGGRFHDPATQTVRGRPWATKQWICCVLSFKNRTRDVWGRYYTELFFCDEVTALAAGHRPCFECRRAEAVEFAAAIARHDGLARAPMAPEMDERLHAERLNGREKQIHRLSTRDLPDGAMILIDGVPHALKERRLLRWSFEGYAATDIALPDMADVLTPPTILAALRAGYSPRWHKSADQTG